MPPKKRKRKSKPWTLWNWFPWRWSKGRWGEFLARWYLRFHGYRIVETNWRISFGEVDIIAWEGDTLCFIEVKRRVNPSPFTPESGMSDKKKHTLSRLVQAYVSSHNLRDVPVRIDFLAIDERKGKTAFRLYQNVSPSR